MRDLNLVCNRACCSGGQARAFNCWMTEVTSSLGATEAGCLSDLVPVAIADETDVRKTICLAKGSPDVECVENLMEDQDSGACDLGTG